MTQGAPIGRRLTGMLAGAEAGDPQLAVKIGRAMAHDAFTGVYRPLLKKNPAEQVAQLPSIADFFFRETRKLESRDRRHVVRRALYL